MEPNPPAWEYLPWMWVRPEPTMPPGLNREQAWAWAMDNFPALCRPSYASGPALGERSRGAHGLLRRAGAWTVDVPGAERGQNPCRDPRVHDPKADSAEDPQAHQGDASARSEGRTDAPGAMLSPSPPRKRLKTQA